ncbi:thioredoxin-disulfide reductase [Candidatus Woesearchaeota archaeon]|nr:thioredoxin-disulfide reductase [Candidatus Woesearchaeota archaeon]
MENVVIIGSGIAGLTAAIYLARAELSPLIIKGNEEGGQLMLTTEVENFPGFPDGITGPQLIMQATKQAERFGTRFMHKFVRGIKKMDDYFVIDVGDAKVEARAIIVSTGASARWLDLPSEKAYRGKGVSACATCDGAFFKDKKVAVIGGGDVACEEADFLTKFASEVTLIHRRDELRASKPMQNRVLNNPKIKFIWNSVVEEVIGDGKAMTALKLKNIKSGEVKEVPFQGMFVSIGHVPNTKFLEGFVDLDEKGYLKVDSQTLQASVQGVWGAGDVHDHKYRQAITAAGAGCQASLEVERYLSEKK